MSAIPSGPWTIGVVHHGPADPPPATHTFPDSGPDAGT